MYKFVKQELFQLLFTLNSVLVTRFEKLKEQADPKSRNSIISGLGDIAVQY